MPVDVTAETRIARPREDVVAAFATDPANDGRWISAARPARVRAG